MGETIESLLIPTDGSDGAVIGAKYGIELASRVHADVHVVSVVELHFAPDTNTESVYETLEADAQQAVESIAAIASTVDESIDVTTTVTRGTPFQSIREYATRRNIDLIVMGTTGRTGLDRILLGSVTENVLRTARTPVLAVPPQSAEQTAEGIPLDQFLIPTDGSVGAEIAAEWGIALAADLDATVHTVFSVDTSLLSRLQNQNELFDRFERQGNDAIVSVRDQATARNVSVSGSIASGTPTSVILTYASDHDIDLIVMGTHGQTGIGQWFLGSVTEHVLRHADVPVFCVPIGAHSP